MSLAEKLRRLLGVAPREPPVSPSPKPEAPAAVAKPAAPPRPVLSPDEAVLVAMGDGTAALDEGRAASAVDALVGTGREARALLLGRAVLARRDALPRLALRLAELAASRGDETLAAAILAPVLELRDASTPALVLGGELAERRGDTERARTLYERALATDIDVPGAKERAARLREARGPSREGGAATLMVEGALTRGRWRILRELGRGGAGTVFLAQDVRCERDVALKVYHSRGPLDRERLRVEARVAAALEHAGVVRIVDLDETLGAIAMEHLASGSLKDAMRRAPLSLDAARAMLDGIAAALAFVHRHGVAHRDLKPSNVLLRDDGAAVLSDFGLARPLGDAAPTPFEGTMSYMAPEQRTGAPSSAAMDVHALGATMREVLGRVAGDVPAALTALADACMVIDPAARPALNEVRRSLA